MRCWFHVLVAHDTSALGRREGPHRRRSAAAQSRRIYQLRKQGMRQQTGFTYVIKYDYIV